MKPNDKANFLLYELPQQDITATRHYKNINVLLEKIKDTKNLAFSFEKEEIMQKVVNASCKRLKAASISRILQTQNIHIKVEDTFYCTYCGAKHLEINQVVKPEVVEYGYTPIMCKKCATSYFKNCANCGKQIFIQTSAYRMLSESFFCIDCFNNLYAKCCYCGGVKLKKELVLVNYKEINYFSCISHVNNAFFTCAKCNAQMPKPKTYKYYDNDGKVVCNCIDCYTAKLAEVKGEIS